MKIARVEAMILRAGDDTSQAAARPRMGTISRSARALDGGYDIDRSRAAYPGCMQTVLVRVTSDEGLVGYGEAHAPLAPEVTRAVVDNLLAPVIVGEDPHAVDVLWERMYTSMRIRGHRTGFMMEAMSGVDIALWDLFGKAVGLPVYRLLGGGYRNRANAYASGVPGATPEARARNALGFLDEGFTAMKLGLGGRGPKASIPFVRAVREAVGDRAHLMVDAQGGYDFYTALAFGRALEEWNVYWVEDPLPPEDISGHRKLTASLDMAVATGEALCARWGFRPWITTGALDVILPDVCRAGGISECHKIANMADAFNIPWAGHVSMGTCVHIAATLHLAAATPNFLICECPASFRTNPLGNVLLEKALDLQDGQFAVPQGPGLGIAFDEEALRGCVVEE